MGYRPDSLFYSESLSQLNFAIKQRTILVEYGFLSVVIATGLPNGVPLRSMLQIENQGLTPLFFVFLQSFKLRLAFSKKQKPCS
jgi:hypothetical protein